MGGEGRGTGEEGTKAELAGRVLEGEDHAIEELVVKGCGGG